MLKIATFSFTATILQNDLIVTRSFKENHNDDLVGLALSLQSKMESSNTKVFEKLKLLNKKIDKIEADSLGLTYLTRLQVGSTHLREHKFRHNFLDSLNPICNFRNTIESAKHYLPHCSNFPLAKC